MKRQKELKLTEIVSFYFGYAKKHLLRFFCVFLFLGFSEAMSVFAPTYYKQFFDLLAMGPESAALSASLVRILFYVFLLHLGGWAGFRVGIYFANRLTPAIMRDLEVNAFDHLIGHSVNFFGTQFSGALVRKLRKLSRAYVDLVDELQWNLWPMLIYLSGSLWVIASRSVTIAVAILVWLVAFTSINYGIARWKQKFDKRRSKADTEVTGVLSDAIANAFNIKVFASAAFEKERFWSAIEAWRVAQVSAWNVGEVNDAVQWLLMIIIEFVMLVVAVDLWREGKITVGDFAMFQGYLSLILFQTRDLGRAIRHMFESLSDAREMIEIINEPQEIRDRRGADRLSVPRGKIEFKNVEFSYQSGRNVLDHLNVVIAPGEKIAIVGPSGAGKSSIIKLLLRFHEVNHGKILIDDQQISKVTQESLRSQIAFVPQEPLLFHRSIMENIRYGKLDATDEDVVKAAKEAHCHQFITDFPEGYDTLVGERGVRLSGGERQRIAIARAILKDAPILVLDEATSSLDSESERLIQDAVDELIQGKTAIVVAHRLSTVLRMDRILVIERGGISEQGTHEQLLKLKGKYWKLWELQAGGFL